MPDWSSRSSSKAIEVARSRSRVTRSASSASSCADELRRGAGRAARRVADAVEQAPVLRGLERLGALVGQAAHDEDRGQRVVGPHSRDRPMVSASTNGCTGPEPASSSRAATSVSVQRVSTVSSTSSTGPAGTEPFTANAFTRLACCWTLFSSSFCGWVSRTLRTASSHGQPERVGEPLREVGDQLGAAQRRHVGDPGGRGVGLPPFGDERGRRVDELVVEAAGLAPARADEAAPSAVAPDGEGPAGLGPAVGLDRALHRQPLAGLDGDDRRPQELDGASARARGRR